MTVPASRGPFARVCGLLFAGVVATSASVPATASAAPSGSTASPQTTVPEPGSQPTGTPRLTAGTATASSTRIAASSTVAGYPSATLRTRLTARSGSLDPTFAGRVLNAASGRAVWTRGSTRAVLPASTAKITTSLTALETFGPNHRYRTIVFRTKASPRTLYLQRSGDLTLTSAQLRRLAAVVAKDAKARGVRSVYVRYDDYLFPEPKNAQGWLPEDVPRWVAPVRALVRDQRNLSDTSADAATYFSRYLQVNGLTVASTQRARTPSDRIKVANSISPVLSTIVADMLRVSQNDYAEALLWTAGIKAGAPKTWAGVTGHARTTLARRGVPLTSVVIRDGSGISRSNRTSAYSLAALVSIIYRDPALRSVFFAPTALPIAGRTGTLETRFGTAPASCAVGRVVGKTGSLKDVTALAGVAHGVDGTPRAFAYVSNRRLSTATVRGRIDVLAATTTMCM